MDQSGESRTWNEEARISCQFAVKCPKSWARLTPTEDAAIRHCPECERDVHLALTEKDFRRSAEEGQCVAVRVITTTDRLAYAVGNAEVPYGRHLQKS